MKIWSKLCLLVVPACLIVALGAGPSDDYVVMFSGGHDIGKDDYGRPCVLIAAALGVQTDVFRKAFSGVTPARNGRPSSAEAKRNKEAMLKVLEPHGVTNDRLDEVANHYRFRPQDGELWSHKDAKAHAVVVDGKLMKIIVDDAGSGYTTPPEVMIKGFGKVDCVVMLNFDKNTKHNGAIKSIEVKK